MKPVALTVCLSSLLLAAACGQDEASPAAAVPSTTAVSTSTGQATSTPPPTSAAAAGGKQLVGTVGEEGNPDAFTIALADASGQAVTTLPAGAYTIQVKDLSKIHNFHLKGGSVDESTTVPEVGDKTFQVNLTAGAYTFICDPHPRMVGQLTVT